MTANTADKFELWRTVLDGGKFVKDVGAQEAVKQRNLTRVRYKIFWKEAYCKEKVFEMLCHISNILTFNVCFGALGLVVIMKNVVPLPCEYFTIVSAPNFYINRSILRFFFPIRSIIKRNCLIYFWMFFQIERI